LPTPLISLQIAYSLLERTVEGELIPMAQDMGLGITPWGLTALDLPLSTDHIERLDKLSEPKLNFPDQPNYPLFDTLL
jgi:hypothetical protein